MLWEIHIYHEGTVIKYDDNVIRTPATIYTEDEYTVFLIISLMKSQGISDYEITPDGSWPKPPVMQDESNVLLGPNAGTNPLSTGSNKLFIANTDTITPLIYGEFDDSTITINGDLVVTGSTDFGTVQIGEYDWTVVSDVAELEAAIAAQAKKIYLKSGATYSLTEILIPYSGLTIMGESIPSDDTNSLSDGVLVTYTYGAIAYSWTDSGGSNISGLGSITGLRGELSFTIGTGMNNEEFLAGQLVSIESITYEVASDVTATTSVTIPIVGGLVRDITGVGNNKILHFTNVIDNIKIYNIALGDGAAGYSSEFYGCKNLHFSKIYCVSGNNDFMETQYCNNLTIDSCASNDKQIKIIGSNGIEIYKHGGSKTSTALAIDTIFIESSCNISVHDNGSFAGLYCYDIHNFEFSNTHCLQTITVTESNHGAIFNCSSEDQTKGFNMFNSADYSITGSYTHPSVTTPVDITGSLSAGYRIFGNSWQGGVIHQDEIRINSRDLHGTISTGTEDLSAGFSHHTLTTGGDHTWILSDFSSIQPDISIRLVVTAETDIATTGVTVAANSEISSFTALPIGTYDVYIETFDDSTFTAYIGTV